MKHAVTQQHLPDLSRLIVALSTLWAYICFCQYMPIWYANIPEETSYFGRRMERPRDLLFVLNLLLNWGVPLLVILPRASKEGPRMLGTFSTVVPLGRGLDPYLLILPPYAAAKPVFRSLGGRYLAQDGGAACPGVLSRLRASAACTHRRPVFAGEPALPRVRSRSSEKAQIAPESPIERRLDFPQ